MILAKALETASKSLETRLGKRRNNLDHQDNSMDKTR